MRWLLVLLLIAPVAADPSHGSDTGARIAPGNEWSTTFTERGTVEFYCEPHPWRIGSIRVEPRSGTPETHLVNITEGEAWSFAPGALTIRAGDTVVWNNTGAVMHQISWMHASDDNPRAAMLWIAAGIIAGIAVAAVINRRFD